MADRIPRPGDVLDIYVSGLGLQGQGVGRWGDLVVFVPGALPGDRVRARVEGRAGRGFVTAELVSLEAPSPHRVEAPCAVAASCGGCQLLHLSYQAQLEWKTTFVREALRRIGKLGDVPVHPCLGAAEPLGYRNKAQFPVVAAYRPLRPGAAPRAPRRRGPNRGRRASRTRRTGRGLAAGPLLAGLYRRGSHEVVPVEECLLQRPVNNHILSAAVRLATELGTTAYDEDTGEGELRHILARVSTDGRQAMAVLVTARSTFPMGRRLAVALQKAVPQVKTVVQNVNTRRTNVILGPRNVILSGPGYIIDRLGELVFRVSPTSFFQVNPEQAGVLYEVAVRMAGGARRAVDIYCGVGTITLYLASRVETLEEIVGVESNPEAVRDALANTRANAHVAGVEKAGFVCGDASTVLREMSPERVLPDTVILDPPRKGCAPEVLQALIRMACERIIYISCSPATLARDLGLLAEGGYTVEEIQPVDMFPQTSHVESCALLTRRSGG